MVRIRRSEVLAISADQMREVDPGHDRGGPYRVAADDGERGPQFGRLGCCSVWTEQSYGTRRSRVATAAVASWRRGTCPTAASRWQCLSRTLLKR
jgi:hypothetical protein